MSLMIRTGPGAAIRSAIPPVPGSARRLTALLLAAAVAGCASYQSLPLSSQPSLRRSVADLNGVTFGHARPLSINEVARLAVLNDPDLLSARAQSGVAEAQLLQAGLLPNPAISSSFTPVLSGPGTTPAWSAGFTEDIRSLITLSARRRGARAAAGEVNASILWQEWQVAGKARLLVIQIAGGEQRAKVLRDARRLLAQRYQRTRRAVLGGNADLTTLSPDLTALGDVEKQIDDLIRLQQTHRHDLNALLGLTPEAVVPLAAVGEPPAVDQAAARTDLTSLADRRPDLIALRLGYAAENARLRTAILSQFPTLNIGLTGGSDTSNVRTIGPQITLDLPIFDRNQGNIAIERATRRQLHDAYSARISAANGEVGALLRDTALVQRQLPPLRRRTREAERIARQADAAFAAGNLTERAYVDFIAARLSRQQELLGLEENLREQVSGLDTLIGAGMPAVSLPKDVP